MDRAFELETGVGVGLGVEAPDRSAGICSLTVVADMAKLNPSTGPTTLSVSFVAQRC